MDMDIRSGLISIKHIVDEFHDTGNQAKAYSQILAQIYMMNMEIFESKRKEIKDA